MRLRRRLQNLMDRGHRYVHPLLCRYCRPADNERIRAARTSWL